MEHPLYYYIGDILRHRQRKQTGSVNGKLCRQKSCGKIIVHRVAANFFKSAQVWTPKYRRIGLSGAHRYLAHIAY